MFTASFRVTYLEDRIEREGPVVLTGVGSKK